MSVEHSMQSTLTDSASVNADNPWPGLLAFRETDEGYFQGRQHETEALIRLVMRERLTVLFGASGLGKSSLLQAGLMPRARRENILPVYVRLDFSSGRPDLVAQVNELITKEASVHQIEAPPARPGETLWEYFHREGHHWWNSRNRPVVPLLIFDQFEEIFTIGRLDTARIDVTQAFVDQLSDLSEGRPPTMLKAWIDAHPEDASAFSFSHHHYKIVLSIREDFLADLEALRARMPAVALNRLRLRGMNGETALLVVNQAPRLIDPDVAVRVVRFVAADQRQLPLADLEVEPALLSVVCRELNNKRKNQGETKISADLLEGNQEQVLTDFYERSTADLPREVRCFIEDHLLTVSGYRDSVALENALSAPGMSREVLDQLVERRLLRREDRGGSPRLELTHDLLAGVVRASRDTRREKEQAEIERLSILRSQQELQQALLKAKEEERLALQRAQERETMERDRRELKRSRVVIGIVLILAFVASGAAVWALRSRRDAVASQQQAVQSAMASERAQREAVRAQQDAERLRQDAERAQEEAVLASQAAVRASQETLRAQREADELRAFKLGNVSVTIPPPRGFTEVFRNFEVRERFPDSEGLIYIAAYFPSDVAQNFKPDQDLTVWAVVAVNRQYKADDVSDALFAEIEMELAGPDVFNSESIARRRDELEKRRGVTSGQPVNMGIVDKTAKSTTTLVSSTFRVGERSMDVLTAITLVHVRRRLLLVYTNRQFNTSQDVSSLLAFTKRWVKNILVTNQ
jgi:hypothetical protein